MAKEQVKWADFGWQGVRLRVPESWNLGKLDGTNTIGPWLHRVTVNLCYTYLSRRRFWTQPIEEVAEYLRTPTGPSPEGRAVRDEIETKLQDGLASLSFKHRAVVVLHYLQGFSLEEIAYILDCPVGTVKSRLHHARRMLRQQLGNLRQELVFSAA